MMIWDKFFLWLWIMFPIVFSAGPANITMAAFGARFGLFKSLHFISGINFIVLLQALLCGFGINQLFVNYPGFSKWFQYLGAIYLIFLAYKFFKTSNIDLKEISNTPSFRDGVILQMLNIKGFVMAAVMFSQFTDIEISGSVFYISILSVGLLCLTTTAMITWTITGSWLIKRITITLKYQNYIFGSMLFGVGIWMIIID